MSNLELKIPPPALVLITAVAMWGLTMITPPIMFLLQFKYVTLLIFISAGLLVMFHSAMLFSSEKTTINPMKPETTSALVTTGLYSYSRNPIYLADLLILIGWGLFLGNLFSLALIVWFINYMNKFQIEPEEQALEKLFGEQYLTYKNRVRRWI